jgi:hypothetical protein
LEWTGLDSALNTIDVAGDSSSKSEKAEITLGFYATEVTVAGLVNGAGK